MSIREETTVEVVYRNIDGHHVFTSDDVYGLYVANEDAKATFDSVCRAIEELMHFNEGITVKVEAEMTFDEFLAHVKASSDPAISVHPAIHSSRRFKLSHAA